MVDFRYHLVSIVAVFVALAVGIVLGAGPLKDASDQQLRDQVQAVRVDNDGLRGQLTDARARTGAADQFAGQIGPGLVARRLARTPVVLVELPGADSGVTDAVSDLLVAAGATVTGTISIRSTWTGTDADTRFVEALHMSSPEPSTATATGSPGPTASPVPTASAQVSGSSTSSPSPAAGALAGAAAQLLARAVAGPPPVTVAGSDPVRTSTATPSTAAPVPSPGPFAGSASVPGSGVVDGPALSALAGAGLIDTAGELTARASAVVVVAAAPSGDEVTDADRTGLDRMTQLAIALRTVGSGEVVAGPATAAQTGGVLADVRADADASATVSTVDSADDPAGGVAVVLALVEQLQGGVGDYGSVGTTDGAVPEITGVSGR